MEEGTLRPGNTRIVAFLMHIFWFSTILLKSSQNYESLDLSHEIPEKQVMDFAKTKGIAVSKRQPRS